MPDIVVVGAGVSGLTCALELAKLGHTITVVAKHMPGDYEAEYASPLAGANVLPMADEANSRWERRTWPYFRHLAASVPEAGVHFQKARVLRRLDDDDDEDRPLFSPNPWFASVMDHFRHLDPSELPPGVRSGCEFTSVCINTMLYLPWLVGQCRARSVVFRRLEVAHIADAAHLSSDPKKKADVVINATGLLSHRLGGVADPSVFPIRGQVVVVRNEAPYMLATSGTDDHAQDMCYVMTRAAGGGTVLGGTFQVGQWQALPDPDVAVRIMRSAVAAHPSLTGGRGIEALGIVRHAVGLRPGREGGVRLEKERIRGVWVVHNYGHGAWGYQGSYGCAERVVELVQDILAQGARL